MANYKVGDYVMVKHRDHPSCDYRASFTAEMTKYEGKVFKVIEVCKSPCEPRVIPDDGMQYTLEGNKWNWTSGMLEPAGIQSSIATFEVGDKVKILPRTKSAGDYDFYFNDDMDGYAGEICTIKEAQRTGNENPHGDSYRYFLEERPFCWSSEMLRLVERDEKKYYGSSSSSSQSFQVGDLVEVLPRTLDTYEYTNPYIDSMLEYIGKRGIITKVKGPCEESTTLDDHYSYNISVDSSHWYWNSTALKLIAKKGEPITTECRQTTLHKSDEDIEGTAPWDDDLPESSIIPKKKYKLKFDI